MTTHQAGIFGRRSGFATNGSQGRCYHNGRLGIFLLSGDGHAPSIISFFVFTAAAKDFVHFLLQIAGAFGNSLGFGVVDRSRSHCRRLLFGH